MYPAGTRHLHTSHLTYSSMFLPFPDNPSLVCYYGFSGDTNQKHVVDAATRNLGLRLLSEGRVDEACPLLRKYLETLEEACRPDMAGGDESLDLIPPLTVLSYAEMLAGMLNATIRAGFS